MPVANSEFDLEPGNPCAEQKEYCYNCHSHFMSVRPHITGVIITKRFFKDLKNGAKAKAIVRDVLDCSNADFSELHKFEEHVNGCMIFRAKKKKMHVVYCVDKNMRLIFMRAFKNFKEYENFLENKNEISKLILQA